MNRPDFDDFAELWQGEPDPKEKERMEAYARRARRHGRLLGYIDYATAILGLVLVIGGALISTNPLTIAAAVPLMIALTWMTYRRRQLRQMARTLNTSGRAAFIESSLRNARANLRRNTGGLVLLPLVVPLALAFKVSIRTGGGLEEVWQAFLVWTHTLRAPITAIILGGMAGFSLRSRRKIKLEILRLEKLRSGYEAEAERDNET